MHHIYLKKKKRENTHTNCLSYVSLCCAAAIYFAILSSSFWSQHDGKLCACVTFIKIILVELRRCSLSDRMHISYFMTQGIRANFNSYLSSEIRKKLLSVRLRAIISPIIKLVRILAGISGHIVCQFAILSEFNHICAIRSFLGICRIPFG